MKINRKKFFDGVRSEPFPGRLGPNQVKGMDAILTEFERRKWTDLRQLAYMLATAKLETAHTMQPIKEYGGNAYFFKMYDMAGNRPHVARALGNNSPGDGVRYCGRGYVQLTGRRNYTLFTPEVRSIFGVDLVEEPDLATRPDIAAYVMFEGMERGSFTGKKLGDFFNEKTTDWKYARKIINGVDRADMIAGIAKQFYADLLVAKEGE